jgi:estrogen-related receptor beta like 1
MHQIYSATTASIAKNEKKEEDNGEDWGLEVERVTPLLKIQLDHNYKDWRLHLEQFKNSTNVPLLLDLC